ncbi:unnamed protein product [Ilex paraguariensis]|uniref:Uncharacterized protein n=1 Tax=Ilex paraguariensis TaxID=185542 RepID=A0ABC8QS56_9AQUA
MLLNRIIHGSLRFAGLYCPCLSIKALQKLLKEHQVTVEGIKSPLVGSLQMKTRDMGRGGGGVDKNGKFKLENWSFAQLHSASGAPGPVLNYQKASMLIIKSKGKGKPTLSLEGNLKFSPATYTSLFFYLLIECKASLPENEKTARPMGRARGRQRRGRGE